MVEREKGVVGEGLEEDTHPPNTHRISKALFLKFANKFVNERGGK